MIRVTQRLQKARYVRVVHGKMPKYKNKRKCVNKINEESSLLCLLNALLAEVIMGGLFLS